MESIWTETAVFQRRDCLTEDRKSEVVVIGAGMAGILTAYFLKTRGKQVTVLEARRTAAGQTSGTTAKITVQHNLIYRDMIQRYGREKAGFYAKMNLWAVDEYQRLVKEHKMACNFLRCSSNLYSCEQEEALKREAEAAETLGIDAEYKTKCELPFEVKGVLEYKNQAQFHPLLFLQKLAEELDIYEDTPVLEVEYTKDKHSRIRTPQGTVTAETVVFACHFPFVNVPGYYFARMYQERSYVLALADTMELSGYYLGIDRNGYSLRKEGDLLLFGGGSHRTGENEKGGKYQMLRSEAGLLWPASKELMHWSAQDCVTLDGIPYIGRFDQRSDQWYVATGFGKWGMTTSMAAARMISAAVVGEQIEESEIFSPQRKVVAPALKNVLKNGGTAVKNLGKQIISPDRTEFSMEAGEMFEVSIRCPHMGCKLKWNADEQSWECPCHGSRFDGAGRVLDNPVGFRDGIQCKKSTGSRQDFGKCK